MILEERDRMAKPVEPDEILEMMPSMTAERQAHKVAGTHNLEAQLTPLNGGRWLAK